MRVWRVCYRVMRGVIKDCTIHTVRDHQIRSPKQVLNIKGSAVKADQEVNLLIGGQAP